MKTKTLSQKAIAEFQRKHRARLIGRAVNNEEKQKQKNKVAKVAKSRL